MGRGVTIGVRSVRLALTALILLLVAGATASASPLSDGIFAFRRGDFAVALRRLAPLAERGDPEAQALLGFMYEFGRGVPQNQVIAVHWYSCAAEQGSASGQYHLGLMYDKGHGVPRSAVLAYKWLNLAAASAPAAERDYYIRIRDAVATKLNPAQLAEGQLLAATWQPKVLATRGAAP
jgi:TPR repeat protein